MDKRLFRWAKRQLPTRESLTTNRWTAPFAHYLLRPALWRLTRRSVPRAIAIGLLVAPIIPIAHTAIAAGVAVPIRANIVVTAATTWLMNPFTAPGFYFAAYRLGGGMMTVDPVGIVGKAQATALGTIVLALILSGVGYLLATLGWRLRVGQKWKRRRKAKAL